jgi:hypothetical protein
LKEEDGTFVSTDSLLQAYDRLQEALQRKRQGAFKPDRERERDELTYALGNKEHSGGVRGMGVIPWKKGFSADMESYKNWTEANAKQKRSCIA